MVPKLLPHSRKLQSERERAESSKGCYEKSSSFSLGPNSCCRTSSNSRLLFCSAKHKTWCRCFIRNKQQAHTRILLKHRGKEKAAPEIEMSATALKRSGSLSHDGSLFDAKQVAPSISPLLLQIRPAPCN